MKFSDKLVFLMKVTQTSNKELAEGISVDPSLISLLRTGKRKQPHNTNHIKNMASFFSRRCSTGFQRNAIAEMLGQRSIVLAMPTEVLAERLESWLLRDPEITETLLSGIDIIPGKPQEPPMLKELQKPFFIPDSANYGSFYFGDEGRRAVMNNMTQIINEREKPGKILISSDDNLEWLISDYALTKQLQANLMELANKGFSFQQVMPAVNFLPRYAEALRFWLPLYSTGQVEVYYYPRLRDNLYRRSMIILPGHYALISSSIGLSNSSTISMFTTDSKIVDAYSEQFNEHLTVCRSALSVYSDVKDLTRNFTEIWLAQGDHIHMASSLSPNTIPRELLEQIIDSVDNPDLKAAFENNLRQLSQFEALLKNVQYIDMVKLASPEDIRAGKIYISFPYKFIYNQPIYTPETYILHLKNILRLLEQYDNYYFIPYNENEHENYNLLVSSEGTALLFRNCAPPLMLKMQRPELVLACQEYLMRKAEQIGFLGIYKEKHRLVIQELIKELQR